METRTIQQLINDDYPKGRFYVYAFRNGYDYLYIGESQNAQYRVSEHLLGKRSNSSLQRALLTNRCSHWVVDFIGANEILSHFGFDKFVKLDYEDKLSHYNKKINQGEKTYLFGGVTWEWHKPNLNIMRDVLASKYRKEFEGRMIFVISPAFNSMGKKSNYKKAQKTYEKYIKPYIANEGIKLSCYSQS